MPSWLNMVERAERIGPDAIGGSSFERLIYCPASATLARRGRGRSSSKDALKGSFKHEVISQCIKNNEEPRSLKGKTLTYTEVNKWNEVVKEHHFVVEPDWIYELNYCWDEYLRILGQYDDTTVHVEKRVTINSISPDLTGTADLITRSRRHLQIRDWKFGVMPVDPDSVQNMFYFLGALELEGCLKLTDLEIVTLGIVQPNSCGEKVKLKNYHPMELYRQAQQLVHDGYSKHRVANTEMLIGNKPEINCGNHCHFCDALYFCPEVEDELTKIKEGKVLTPEQIAINLDRAELQASYLAALKDEAMATLQAGKHIPGWHVGSAPGRGSRSFNNPEKVVEILTDEFGDFALPISDIVDLKSVAQVEKIVGKKMKNLENFVVKTPGFSYPVLEKAPILDF